VRGANNKKDETDGGGSGANNKKDETDDGGSGDDKDGTDSHRVIFLSFVMVLGSIPIGILRLTPPGGIQWVTLTWSSEDTMRVYHSPPVYHSPLHTHLFAIAVGAQGGEAV